MKNRVFRSTLNNTINIEELNLLNDLKNKKSQQPEISTSITGNKIINKSKQNKSLIFNGKNLNLSERFKIANKLLNINDKLRTLNIKDLEKYQLLAYILGCDKDNARNIMNGSYDSKDRDLELENYFNDLDLNK